MRRHNNVLTNPALKIIYWNFTEKRSPHPYAEQTFPESVVRILNTYVRMGRMSVRHRRTYVVKASEQRSGKSQWRIWMGVLFSSFSRILFLFNPMLTHQRFHHISINLLASILPVIAHDFRLLLIRNGDIEIDKNGFSFPHLAVNDVVLIG